MKNTEMAFVRQTIRSIGGEDYSSESRVMECVILPHPVKAATR